jgi:hypothetical protein
MGQQNAAFKLPPGAGPAQRFAQFPEIGKAGELIEGGDLVGHAAGLSGGQEAGKVPKTPARIAVIPWPSIAQRGANVPRKP